MITGEQLVARASHLGGSDAHKLAGVDGPGGGTLLDLWSKKRRGANLDLDPLIAPDFGADKPQHHGQAMAIKADPRAVGNAMESAVVALYENQTGLECVEHETFQHPEHAWAQANADRVVYESREYPDWSGFYAMSHGLEAKLVGRWGVDRWGSDGLPGYVICQVQWCMGCSGLDRWDVCAWLAGTEVRIVTVQRDEDLIEGLFELGRAFWEDHVLADRPPPPSSGEDLMRFLGRRFPKENGELVEVGPDIAGAVEAAATRHKEITEAMKALKAEKSEVTAALCGYVGENKGITGRWGKFTNGGRAGSVSWKKVAEHVNGGPVADDVLEDFRGAPCRVAKLYPFKPQLTKGKVKQLKGGV